MTSRYNSGALSSRFQVEKMVKYVLITAFEANQKVDNSYPCQGRKRPAVPGRIWRIKLLITLMIRLIVLFNSTP